MLAPARSSIRRDVDKFFFAGADYARDNFLAARRQLASDRGEVLDAAILQVLRRLEPGDDCTT